MDREIQSRILAMQRNEITEYHIYTRLAKMLEKNRERTDSQDHR